MHEGMLHIHDVEGPKKTGSVETRLEAMDQQVFKCQGMVERGLNANHMMITEFTNKHKMDANDIGKHLSRLYDRVDQLQGQIYDLQNQNCSDIASVVKDMDMPNLEERFTTLVHMLEEPQEDDSDDDLEDFMDADMEDY
ncbi:40S ribosomal protein S5-1 [Hordeum vulgare]|nr:40S ribosomal protein S5-1 [Hordeum vulgare]